MCGELIGAEDAGKVTARVATPLGFKKESALKAGFMELHGILRLAELVEEKLPLGCIVPDCPTDKEMS
jgi:hypothetical protein